jgi:CDGSH-type Zn-finger protein
MSVNPEDDRAGPRIQILKNGPYRVSGRVPLAAVEIVERGDVHEYRQVREYAVPAVYTLCRCGKTTTPPFCDGSHEKHDFAAAETASRRDYAERADLLAGPDLDLRDDHRCALAHFCYRKNSNAWELTEQSDDPQLRDEAILAAINCPTGRLEVYNKRGHRIEPTFSPGLEILQDEAHDVSGPIYVKGGIPIEAPDGFVYEVRNRIALCRCGESSNTPFCDATHVMIDFHDHLDDNPGD